MNWSPSFSSEGVKLTPVRGGLGRAFAVVLGRDVRMDLVARDAW